MDTEALAGVWRPGQACAVTPSCDHQWLLWLRCLTSGMKKTNSRYGGELVRRLPRTLGRQLPKGQTGQGDLGWTEAPGDFPATATAR